MKPSHAEMPTRQSGIEPGRAWRWARRSTQCLALFALVVGPVIGGWQRLDYTRERSSWSDVGWGLPVAIQQFLPVSISTDTLYEVNQVTGGGIAAELLTGITEGIYGRGAGMMLWGTAVAFLADRMESRRARGRLTVLTGPLKGRSFPVNQNKLRIARSVSADLTIPGDPADVDSTLVGDAALVRLKKGTVVLEPSKKANVEINGEKAGTTELRYDDIVKIDGVTLIYEAKR
jgi:hypothetical protein